MQKASSNRQMMVFTHCKNTFVNRNFHWMLKLMSQKGQQLKWKKKKKMQKENKKFNLYSLSSTRAYSQKKVLNTYSLSRTVAQNVMVSEQGNIWELYQSKKPTALPGQWDHLPLLEQVSNRRSHGWLWAIAGPKQSNLKDNGEATGEDSRVKRWGHSRTQGHSRAKRWWR